MNAWSIKCEQNKQLIAQFACELRDEPFEPNCTMILQCDAIC